VGDERPVRNTRQGFDVAAGEGVKPKAVPTGGQAAGPANGSNGIPVIGLGGSAGALAPFEAFFDAMPADSGAAFVVIQHMSANNESYLPELLAKHTPMPVVQAQEGMHVEPNRVYVIPPSHQLGIRDEILYFAEPVSDGNVRMYIDFFFRSLAEAQEEKAICILFSGAGSDGTLGAGAVRGAGGLVIAQDPETAQFKDMPGSAKAAGVVDYVLAPGKMPEAIMQYLQHPYVKGARRPAVPESPARPEDVQDILAWLLAQTRCDFRSYKKATILRRIGRRMGLLHMSDMAKYNSLLHHDANEVRQLLKDLLIKVTSFFRDPEAFQELRAKAIATFVQARSSDEPIRVWVPGCASGEEAYSLVMLLTEELVRAGKNCPLQVFATDVDEDALEVARRGAYSESIAADMSAERLERFFVRSGDGYQVTEALRAPVTFAAQNVLSDPPFSRMDLISCRNLLIYLDTDAQTKLMTVFNFALKPGGYLFLGRSETVGEQSDLFETVSHKGRLARRVTPTHPLVLDSPILPGRRRSTLAAPPPGKPAGSNFADVVRLEILRHYNASAVLIDSKGQILQFHGQTDKYLNLPAAGPTFNILNLAKGKLPTKLRLAIHRALGDDKASIVDKVPLSDEASPLFARVTVVPVAHKTAAEPLLIVFFDDVQSVPVVESVIVSSPESETLVNRLEEELRATQQDLRTTIEELQSSNEDLRAANEEVNSANEELQSINEEMVTSTEELQSTNEELTAVNSQLREKIELLDTVNSDMANLLKSSEVAAMFLDCKLRIKFFTPEMARILNMVPSDMGRPLANLSVSLINCDFTADVRSVTHNDSVVEREVQHPDGSSYLMRLMPYCKQGNQSDGVVATLNDITRLRRTEKQLAAIVESSNDAIFAKTIEGVIVTWNPAAESMYGYSAAEVVGKNVFVLAPPDRANEIDEILGKLKRGDTIKLLETVRITKDGRKIDVALAISPVKDASGRIVGASTVARDITDRKRSQDALKKSEERFRLLVEASPNAILLADEEGAVTLLNRQAEAMFGYSRQELMGQPVEILMPERFRSRHPSYRAEFVAHPQQRPMGAGRDLFAARKDGSEFPVEIGLTPLEMPEGLVTLATITDITERKRQAAGR